MTIPSYADVTGDGTAKSITAWLGVTTLLQAAWFQITYITGSGPSRLGGPSVDASSGIPVVGGGQFVPPNAQSTIDAYDLWNIYLYIPNGDVVNIGYAV